MYFSLQVKHTCTPGLPRPLPQSPSGWTSVPGEDESTAGRGTHLTPLR